MQVVLDCALFIDDAGLFKTMRKEVDTEIVPIIGMTVDDSGLPGDGIQIRNVTCNFQEAFYHVALGDRSLPTKEECHETAEMMKLHGWK